MKKITLLALAAIVMVGTGCLKDKDFENQKYGIKDPGAGSAQGVGFNLQNKTNFKRTIGVVITDQPQEVDGDAVMLALYAGSKAPKDIHIKVAVDTSILFGFNRENGTEIDTLPTDKFTIVTDAVIPAGQQYAPVKITIPSTQGISPDRSYGIALKIVSVDGGYTVSSNMAKTLVEIVIKNEYDGEYMANGFFYHPSAPRPIEELPKTLSTVNATSVAVDLGDLGPAGYYAIFDTDPVTHNVTIRQFPGSVALVDFGTGLPSTSPGYTPQWANSAECNNIYVPSEQAFKVRYGYVGGTGYRVTEEIIEKL